MSWQRQSPGSVSKVSLSQFGEDLRLLAKLNLSSGFFLEIGACDGLIYSNTYLFEQLGWSGILVEADPDLARKCSQNRPRSRVENVALSGPQNSGKSLPFQRVKGSEEHSAFAVPDSTIRLMKMLGQKVEVEKVLVDCVTADELLRRCEVVPGSIDFCTIDVEGSELDVLNGFNLAYWRPKFLLIENNQAWPQIQILRRLGAQGYRWCGATGVNDWFVLRDTHWSGIGDWSSFVFWVTPRRLLKRYLHQLVLKLKGLS